MDGTGEHNAQWNKPDSESGGLNVFTHMDNQEQSKGEKLGGSDVINIERKSVE